MPGIVKRQEFVRWLPAWLVCCQLCLASVCAADWRTVLVPGVPPTGISGSDAAERTVWYRCWVLVPDSYFARHERNLFEESVGIHLRDLVGRHELWVNGVRIGMGQADPPADIATPGILFRHKVPAGTLQNGLWNEVSLKLVAPLNTAGFRGQAPFIMDYFLECIFEGEWEISEGTDYSPGRASAERPARAAYDQFRESQQILARTEQVHGDSLPPEESVDRMKSVDGLQTELLLHEPIVTQPFHFTFDECGRLWVAQSRQYPYPAGIRMLSRDKYYRAHYDNVPAPPPDHTPGADIISVHEDTDGDGAYDRHTTFQDGLNMANSAIRGRGGVWVMHTPHLLFYPDANADDVPDGPPQVRLSGFGFEDTHSIANGLTWGPDGWLYGGQGSTCSCRVTRPGIDPPDSQGVYFEGCMVWRYHPDTRAFEIFAEGGGNTYGLEFDIMGRLYSGHNGGDTRGWHFVQGGFYQMQGVNPGKFGPPRNPYAYGDLPMLATKDRIVRFTHIGAFVDGSAMPPEYAGALFAIDPLHNEVIAANWEEKGSTFVTSDIGVVVRSADPAFRPVHIANAPDGSLLVSDMYEFYIAHGQHYQNQIDPTTGRLYRISGAGMPRESDLNLAGKSDAALLNLLGHPNKWHRMTAVRLLGERHIPSTIKALQTLASAESGITAWHALWALHQAGGLDESTAAQTLRHPQAPIRLWTTRFLGDIYGIQRNLGLPGAMEEARPIPPQIFDVMLDQASVEPNAEVRSQFAATARRLEASQGFQLAAEIMKSEEDLNDPFIPLMCWWVFEAHIPSRTDQVVEFFLSRPILHRPLVMEHVLPRLARRLAVDGKRHDLLLLARLFGKASSRDQSLALLQGYEEAFRGRSMTSTSIPDELALALDDLSASSLALRLRQGNPSAFVEAKAQISRPEFSIPDRLLFIRIIGEIRRSSDMDFLLDLAASDADPSIRMAAFASLGGFDDNRIIEVSLKLLPDLPADIRMSALTLVSTRKKWLDSLLEELNSGRLDKSIIPLEFADLLSAHRDDGIRNIAGRYFQGNVSGVAGGGTLSVDGVKEIIQSGPGNPYAGESIYMGRCGACHRLFFKGGEVGPDLTTYQRKDLGTLLTSILYPDAEIREGFQFVTIHTSDERTLSGFEVDRDFQVTVLRGLDGQNVTLENSLIQERVPSRRSLMPAGLLENLDHSQIRDLFAYLRISQPISQ